MEHRQAKPDRSLTNTHAFIIRVWCEAVDEDGKAVFWRGSIDHVGGDRRLYFEDFDGACRFIEEQTGIRLNRPASWWRSIFARSR